MLAHEALHCALLHFARRAHRIKHRWDLACDFAINPLLIEDGLTPPPDSLWMDEYRGMTAEEIYPLLEEHEEMETLDLHLYDQERQAGRQWRVPAATHRQKPAAGRQRRGAARRGGAAGQQRQRAADTGGFSGRCRRQRWRAAAPRKQH